jgi:outer membrane protein assembly factor BamB
METESGRSVIYLGTKGCALALSRASGEVLWKTRLAGSDFVSLMVDGDAVLAGTKGEVFCLDAATGSILWRNGLPGMGFGLISIATENGSTSAMLPQAKRKKDAEAAGAATAGIAVTAVVTAG